VSRARPRPLAWLLVALGLLAPAPAVAPAQGPAAGGVAPAGGVARVSFLDIGQGDAILIRSPEGRTALIDAGLDRSVVDRIKECGVTALDLVVVTHHHTDHYGGMDDVLEAFRPRYFLAARTSHTTSMFVKLLRMVRDQGITALAPASSARKIQLGSVTLTVLPQPPEDTKEENDNSIAIRLTHGALDVLMTGDSEEPARAWWREHCPELLRDCDVLKLAHHGSRNGTDPEWLDLVRPRVAVASLGKGNSYGHPHSETLELLAEKGVPLLRTDERGTITIRSDGRRWSVDKPSAGELASGPAERSSSSASSSSGVRRRSKSPGGGGEAVTMAQAEGPRRGWTGRRGRSGATATAAAEADPEVAPASDDTTRRR
jgi:beta-lactamase superfamily II metal-dependent hydrolase